MATWEYCVEQINISFPDACWRIVKVQDRSFGTYGCRRVTAELRLGLGRHVNHTRVVRLMRERGLSGATQRRRWRASHVRDERQRTVVTTSGGWGQSSDVPEA